MQTLSYGYLKPQNPDTGDIFYPALESDIQKMNDHTHNGVNSALVAIASQTILNANWVAAPGLSGIFRQVVTVAAPYTYDASSIMFKLSSGELVYPTTERISASSYYVYTNNNALDYVAYYR